MQTFLPYPDFVATSLILDPRRLGKQRVEAIQVLRGLTVVGYGWRHHPAVAMWAGYEEALTRYGMEMCRAWCEIGYADTCATTLLADFRRALGVDTVRPQDALAVAGELPPWLGRRTSTAATGRLCCARIPSTTRGGSPVCRWTCPTCGRCRIGPAVHPHDAGSAPVLDDQPYPAIEP
ncbi:MSMEG_6728 family protein [Nonomuraea recticatena]|uniref:MSMEG_6728 family protein n=1 Tax=Nonomuraea recticatena TaxID=46178 RepID=UPI0036151752